jgi:hypothetical protein
MASQVKFSKKFTSRDPRTPLSGHPRAHILALNYVDIGMDLWVFGVPKIDITMYIMTKNYHLTLFLVNFAF